MCRNRDLVELKLINTYKCYVEILSNVSALTFGQILTASWRREMVVLPEVSILKEWSKIFIRVSGGISFSI